MHQNTNQNKNKQHVAVLVDEVLNILKPKAGDSYLDLTAGYGGHASTILSKTGSLTNSVLIDRDQAAIDQLRQKLGSKIEILHQDYYSASLELVKQKRQFDLILADLGVSSPHLKEEQRGFSFNSEHPLDMRMDMRQDLTADQIVNRYSQKELEKIIRNYGEEPKYRLIAKLIVSHRPIKSSVALASLVKRAWPKRSKVHPATRTFMALRIAVNDELNQLSSSLPLWLKLLKPGGRIAVISFHSLEDKIVKDFFNELSRSKLDSPLMLLTKHPIQAEPHEIEYNPRSRSAKLRAAAKIKTKGNSHAY